MMYRYIKNSKSFHRVLFLLLAINISVINSTVNEYKSNEPAKKENNRVSKQIFVNFDEKDIATISPTSAEQQQRINNENNLFDYQNQGLNNPIYSDYYKNDENRNYIKLTDIDGGEHNRDSSSKLKTKDSDNNYTSFKDNVDVIKSIKTIDSSLMKKDIGSISMTREGKDFTYAYPSSGSDNAVSSSNSFSSSGSSSSYKYPYPYSGSSDPGTASYYYHDDKNNYWHTAPPAAITPEKPVPPSATTMLECHPSSPGIFSEIFRVGGLAKVSIVKTLLIAALALLAIKIPALLILKAIIIKAVLIPFGAISILLPVLLPLMYFWPNLAASLGLPSALTPNGASPPAAPAAAPQAPAAAVAAAPAQAPANGASAAAPAPAPAAAAPAQARSLFDFEDQSGYFESRAASPIFNSNNFQEVFLNLLNSERCLERIACKLGERDSKSTYRKHISWLLKRMQIAVTDDVRRHFKLYREAYNLGASKEGICDRGYYPCETPKVQLIQNSRTYRII